MSVAQALDHFGATGVKRAAVWPIIRAWNVAGDGGKAIVQMVDTG